MAENAEAVDRCRSIFAELLRQAYDKEAVDSTLCKDAAECGAYLLQMLSQRPADE